MNNVIQGTVKELERRYKDLSDNEMIREIIMGRHAGEALFYLLFGRYVEMLHALFVLQSKPSMEFDDFMLELDIRLFVGHCAAIHSFDETKASFKTYLSKIAHNLLYDMKEKEIPMLDVTLVEQPFSGIDEYEIIMLIDAINSYPNQDSRYVLFKTIEGYKSKEIAEMLTNRRHEEGTLEMDQQLKPSYIDTLRSRSLRAIRRQFTVFEEPKQTSMMAAPVERFEIGSTPHDIEEQPRNISSSMALPRTAMTNLFIQNIYNLYNQMMEK